MGSTNALRAFLAVVAFPVAPPKPLRRCLHSNASAPRGFLKSGWDLRFNRGQGRGSLHRSHPTSSGGSAKKGEPGPDKTGVSAKSQRAAEQSFSSRIPGLFEMEIRLQRRSSLCCSGGSLAEAGETGAWAAHKREIQPTVCFSGRAKWRTDEFTRRRSRCENGVAHGRKTGGTRKF